MCFRRSITIFFLALVFGCIAFADWRPIAPADLVLKQSRVDPNADAEALFREVHISNVQHGASYAQNIVSEYVRLKIFTERGKEFGNVQVPFFGKTNIYDVQGRTIHPDGSIVELGRDAIFSKVLQKKGYKTKVMTFTMPAVEPGSIIEYRFSKNEGEFTSRYQPLEVQSTFPVDELTFFLKPLSNVYVDYPAMRYLPFRCNPERLRATSDGFEVLRLRNVPAYHEEPYSPPVYGMRQWILVYYEDNSKSGKDQYWAALGKDLYGEYSQRIKVNGELKALATEIMSGAVSDDDKLDKLLTWCRTQLKDVSRDEVAAASQTDTKANRNTIDTIHRKTGSQLEINYAFLALAEAAGFEARRAYLSDRGTFLFAPTMQSRYFLNNSEIAVNVGGNWSFFDVANLAVPGGQLRWQEQGVFALISDSKRPEMVQTPMIDANHSLERRIAELSLSESGTLEGDVRDLKLGNYASEWRDRNRYTNEDQRLDELREELKQRFSDFAATNIAFHAPPDPSKPVSVTYHIVIPHYAQRTGKRLFVQPNYFSAGFGSRFTENTRYNDIYFDFPWSEYDTVKLKAPAGYQLDHPDRPGGIRAAPVCEYGVSISLDKEKNQVIYERHLIFGKNGQVMFDQQAYPTLKKVFDGIHEADEHMLTLKAVENGAADGQ